MPASLALPLSSASAATPPTGFTAVALPTYQTNNVVWATAAAGGRVFAGGDFTSVRPPGARAGTSESARHGLVVLDAATGIPTSCAPSVDSTSGPASVRALSVSPDGATLYLGGRFDSVNGTARNNLAAIDIASCTVTAFAPTADGLVRTIAATASQVFLGGEFTEISNTPRTKAAAVTPAGTLTSWAPALDGLVNALAVKPGGSQVVIGGAFGTVNSTPSVSLAVVDATTGGTVKAYPAGFFPTDRTAVKDLAVDSTGFYVASEGSGNADFDGRTAVDWSSLDKRWIDNCLGATQAVVVYHGLLYSGSHAHDCTSQGWFSDGPRHHLLAESVNGPVISSWFPDTDDGINEGIGPRDLVVASSGSADYLWLGGEFLTTNGTAQQGLTRFGRGTVSAPPSAPKITATSYRPGQVRVAWLPSVDNDNANLTYRLYRDGTLLTTMGGASSFWNRPELDYTDTGVAAGSAHNYRVTVSDPTSTVSSGTAGVRVGSVTSPYRDQVLADGAQQLLSYDEPGEVFLSDTSDHHRSTILLGTGDFQRGPAVVGDPGHAFAFTGTSSSAYSATRVPADPSFTEETWFKTTSTAGGVLMSFSDRQTTVSAIPDRQVFMYADGRLGFGVVTATNNTVLSSPKAYNDGVWHHLAATQDGNGIALYLDGHQVSSTAARSVRTGTGYWHLGGDLDAGFGGPANDYWVGALDETAFYSKALTPAQVVAHAQRLVATPSALNVGKASVLTVQGAPGDVVSLLAYSQPSTTYAPVRSGTIGAGGTVSFSIAPRTNTRVLARTAAGDSASSVVYVRPAESLRGSAAGKVGSFTGQLVPGHGGVTVRLFTVKAGRLTLVGSAKTTSSGAWSYKRTFATTGAVTFISQTVSDATNLSGQSNRVTLTFR